MTTDGTSSSPPGEGNRDRQFRAELGRALHMPDGLTGGGQRAFAAEMVRSSEELTREINKLGYDFASRGGNPEYSANDVQEARRAYLKLQEIEAAAAAAQRTAGARAQQSDAARRQTALAVILTGAGGSCAGLMANCFTHSPWQFAIFVAANLCQGRGWWLTWRSWRHSSPDT